MDRLRPHQPHCKCCVPEMTKFGYAKKSTGIVVLQGAYTAQCCVDHLGIVTQQSIGKLFLAGIIPGLLIAFFFVVVILAGAG